MIRIHSPFSVRICNGDWSATVDPFGQYPSTVIARSLMGLIAKVEKLRRDGYEVGRIAYQHHGSGQDGYATPHYVLN